VDDAETFLTLDWPEEGTNINLLEDESAKGSYFDGAKRTSRTNTLTPSALSTPRTAMRRRRAMLGLAPPPTGLMTSTPAPLYQMLHQNNAQQKGFRLSICSIDTSTGALLMDANNRSFHPDAALRQCRSVTKTLYDDRDDDDDDFGGDHEMGDTTEYPEVNDGEEANGEAYAHAENDDDDDDEVDFWAPLDPHDASGVRLKPFKKGANVRKRMGRARAAVTDRTSTDSFSFGKQMWQWKADAAGTSRIFAAPHAGGFDEFAEIRKRFRSVRRKWKEEQTKRMARRRRRVVLDDHDDAVDDDDDDDRAFFDLGDEGSPEEGVANDNDDDATWSDFVGGDDANAAEDAPTRISSPSYENLVRAHLAEWFRGAEKYERTTQLSRRVSEWTKRLEPILAAEETHPPFDIHDVGGEILQAVDSENKACAQNGDDDSAEVPFDAIVRGKVEYEVCRTFLAMLQLANDGNLEIMPGVTDAEKSKLATAGRGEEEGAMGRLSVVLKSTAMADSGAYRAPSVASAK